MLATNKVAGKKRQFSWHANCFVVFVIVVVAIAGVARGTAPALAKKRHPPPNSPCPTPGTVIAADKTQKQRDFYM